MSKTCGKETTVWSRVSGYCRPVSDWNAGKQQEFKERKAYGVAKSLESEYGKRDEKIEEVA